eukprot:TRINITY_DN9512_c0_g2_i1.p4 TRINITY_DN9512_c0_g2~~TRINITY_DN9512_c0_g2_i1.p4  ORF type:complete len:118 (-),score=39.65 TRINITY_DN9512_c0_g2_i1:622-975(-)
MLVKDFFFFFQAEDGIRDVERSRGLGDVYKRQVSTQSTWVATQSPSGKVYIYDYTKHPLKPEIQEPPKPELTLDAQKKEGFGLSWNPKLSGQLLSSSFDGCIYLWDIEKNTQSLQLG